MFSVTFRDEPGFQDNTFITMKTLPAIAFLFALAASLLLPMSFAAASTLTFAAGFFAVLFGDYAQPARRSLTPAYVAVDGAEKFRLAA